MAEIHEKILAGTSLAHIGEDINATSQSAENQGFIAHKFKKDDINYDSTLSPRSQQIANNLEENYIIENENMMHSVFEWEDPKTKLKKVTVVLTLPSGVDTNTVKVLLNTPGDSGVTQEIVVKYPWSKRFMEAKTVFETSENKGSEFYLHPESIEYEKSIDSMRANILHTPNACFRVHLPIPVQSAPNTFSQYTRSFAPKGKGDKNGPRQEVFIMRFTGVVDYFARTYATVSTKYESGEE